MAKNIYSMPLPPPLTSPTHPHQKRTKRISCSSLHGNGSTPRQKKHKSMQQWQNATIVKEYSLANSQIPIYTRYTRSGRWGRACFQILQKHLRGRMVFSETHRQTGLGDVWDALTISTRPGRQDKHSQSHDQSDHVISKGRPKAVFLSSIFFLRLFLWRFSEFIKAVLCFVYI